MLDSSEEHKNYIEKCDSLNDDLVKIGFNREVLNSWYRYSSKDFYTYIIVNLYKPSEVIISISLENLSHTVKVHVTNRIKINDVIDFLNNLLSKFKEIKASELFDRFNFFGVSSCT